MALVNVSNVVVHNNPAQFLAPFQFEVTFECSMELQDDLEWRVIYVGSAESTNHDQVLDEVMVGPVPVGVSKFVLQADPPNISAIPDDDIIGVTIMFITCSYLEQEFVRIGYYVNNEYQYSEPFEGTEPPPPPRPIDASKVSRSILAEKPRVTRYPIQWTSEAPAGEGDAEHKPTEREATLNSLSGTSLSNGPVRWTEETGVPFGANPGLQMDINPHPFREDEDSMDVELMFPSLTQTYSHSNNV